MPDDTQSIHLLCRNRVANFETWLEVFRSHRDGHERAGLHLMSLWRAVDEPNNVFFVFAVESRDRALAFMAAPESKLAGEQAGVLDGEYHFVAPLALKS